MNPKTRRAALYAIGAIAILASANALAHSYAGLYDWALHHRLGGWQAKSWPAEIDVFLAVGELALYVAYLDDWPGSQRVWPWVTAIVGLAVSVAGNIGHIQAKPGEPVILADRVTAATSPLAAFAGLAIGLLVLKMTRQQPGAHRPSTLALVPSRGGDAEPGEGEKVGPDAELLNTAVVIYRAAAERGERLSQRALARELRDNGHSFPNGDLNLIARTVGLMGGEAA